MKEYVRSKLNLEMFRLDLGYLLSDFNETEL